MPTTRDIEYLGQSYKCSPAHKATDVLPWDLGEDFAATVEDMRANGYNVLFPILNDKYGKLIDGRHRELAALVAGVKPVYKTLAMTDEQVALHVRRSGLNRRHLTPSQKAACAVELSAMLPRGRPVEKIRHGDGFNSTADVAADAGVSRRTVEAAATVQKKDAELFEQVKAGDLPVRVAEQVAGLPARERKKVTAAENPTAEARRVLAAAKDGQEAAHPFADLLGQTTRLAHAVTKAVREESPEGKRLHAYLSLAGLLTHEGGEPGQKGATLVALRGVYRLVDLAGHQKTYSEQGVKQQYLKASGGWVPPLTARRRKGKNARLGPRVYDL